VASCVRACCIVVPAGWGADVAHVCESLSSGALLAAAVLRNAVLESMLCLHPGMFAWTTACAAGRSPCWHTSDSHHQAVLNGR
jgi:hypothetical protein